MKQNILYKPNFHIYLHMGTQFLRSNPKNQVKIMSITNPPVIKYMRKEVNHYESVCSLGSKDFSFNPKKIKKHRKSELKKTHREGVDFFYFLGKRVTIVSTSHGA